MAKCFKCNQGPPAGPAVYRINETGVDGIWACKAHLPSDVPVDPQVQSIVDAISENPPAEGIVRDVNGSIVEDYSDTAAECTDCGASVSWGRLKTNPAILDDWQDCGDEVYCPACKTQPDSVPDATMEDRHD